MLLINLDSTGGRPGHIHPEILRVFDLHCSVLQLLLTFIDTLASEHKLETQDWLLLTGHAGLLIQSARTVKLVSATCQRLDSISQWDNALNSIPLRPQQLNPVKDEWRTYIVDGTVTQLLNRLPLSRMRLTLHCQMCDMRYQTV